MNVRMVLFMALVLLLSVAFAEVDIESTLTKKNLPAGLKPAIIFDNHIRFGAEAHKAQRDLKTIKTEPPAAVLPPITKDPDDAILDMAYDLSFEPRPNANKVLAKKLNKGAKFLNAIVKMKEELQWALNNGRDAPKKKVAKKGKKGGKKGKKAAKKF